MELNKFVEKRGKKLNKDQISRLLIILNNPLAFHWLTQESHYLKAGLIFYDFENKIIACIDIYNNGLQIKTYPKDIRMKTGLLLKKEGLKFNEILMELGLDLN